MALGSWGIGRLALWRELRKSGAAQPPLSLPRAKGPLLLIRASQDASIALAQVQKHLQHIRPDLHILRIDDQYLVKTGTNLATAKALIDATNPAALLLLGTDLPPAQIVAASQRGIPIILAEARFDEADVGWTMQGAMRRELLQKIGTILVTDEASQRIAQRMGVPRGKLVMTGPVAEIREPLTYVEEERSAFADLMRGRHAWFAASVPQNEEQAVLRAHEAALQQSHRALLFIAPRDPARVDDLADEIEASGLTVARRRLDEDPTDEVQVMVTDGTSEMGLWYRLAPVTYIGGTLMGEDTENRHPFEPAALGSAIVHGPVTGKYATEWQQLQGAKAARQINDASELATAIAELTLPEHIATLASNAWIVSTGGAEVTMRICTPVLDILAKEPI